MFHHRSIGFGGSANVHSVNTISSNNHGQNENSMIHRGHQRKPSGTNNSAINKNVLGGKNSIVTNNLSKTPAGKKGLTTRRRAFGDISNKKASNNGFGRDSSTNKQQHQHQQKQKPHSSDVLKPRSNNILPRLARNAPSSQKTRFVVLPEEPKQSHSQQPQQQQQSTKKSIKKKNGSALRDPLSVPVTRMKTRSAAKVELVPDIELPAGRTWKQQLDYDLKDEDDLASTSSLDSILNLKDYLSPRARWDQERELELKRQKEEADEDDRQLQVQIKMMMDREQKETEEGLDSLFDVIDNLDIFSDDGLGKNDNSILREDWSLSDSSAFDLNSSADDDLLFPL